MEPLISLSDGRLVSIGQDYNDNSELVNTLRLFAADGTEITSGSVEFAAGTPAGAPFSNTRDFALQELPGGGFRLFVQAEYDFDTSQYVVDVFDVDASGAPLGPTRILQNDYASELEMPYRYAMDRNGSLLTLSDGSLALATAQSLVLFDANGVYQSVTQRPGPFESVNESALAQIGNTLLRVSHVNVSGTSFVEIRGQFYTLDGTESGDEFLVAPQMEYAFGHWDVEVAELTDGRIAVAYVAGRPADADESESAVYLTILNGDGSVAVAEQMVNTGDVAGAQDWVNLWALPEGGLAVTYGTETNFTPTNSVNVRLFDDSGTQTDSFQQMGIRGRDNGERLHVSQTGVVTLMDPQNPRVLTDFTLGSEPGVVGDEILLSQNFLGELAEDVEIATLSDGRVVVVYDHTNLDGYVRIFDPATGMVSDVAMIPRGSDGVREMTVVALSDGGFATAWRTALNGVTGDVVLQVFNADGSVRNGPQTILDGEGEHVKLIPSSAGFALAWVDDTGTLDDDEQIQFFDLNGSALGAVFEYQPARDVEIDVDSALLTGGNTVLVWKDADASFVRSAVFQIFQPDGTALFGAPQQIQTDIDGRQPVKVVATPDGGFATVHVDRTGTFFLSVYDANGGAITLSDPLPKDPDLPNNTDPWQTDVYDIALTGDGQLVVVYGLYVDAAAERDLRYMIFDLDGTAIVLHGTVNENIADDQEDPSVTTLDDGTVMVAFMDDTNVQFGAQSAIRAAILQGGDLPPEPPLTDTGTTDPDDIAGGTGPDTLSGGLGNDTVDGGAGDDDILGGVGFDALEGGAGHDTLVGQDGFDALSGGSGDDLLQGNNGLDTLAGGAGNDTLLGGLGSDTLLGDSGDDLLTGQSGFDSLDGGAGHDTLNGNSGADTLSGGDDNDMLNGGIANDLLSGDAGDDTVNGGNGADMVSGGDGDDRLSGNSGSDTISGGAGSDVLLGGIGIDTFVFALGDGQDRIGDFGNNIDVVHLDADLLSEAAPVPDDLRTYASFNADGFLVLSFGSDSLTFTNVFTTTAVLDDVQFV